MKRKIVAVVMLFCLITTFYLQATFEEDDPGTTLTYMRKLLSSPEVVKKYYSNIKRGYKWVYENLYFNDEGVYFQAQVFFLQGVGEKAKYRSITIDFTGRKGIQKIHEVRDSTKTLCNRKQSKEDLETDKFLEEESVNWELEEVELGEEELTGTEKKIAVIRELLSEKKVAKTHRSLINEGYEWEGEKWRAQYDIKELALRYRKEKSIQELVIKYLEKEAKSTFLEMSLDD